MSPQHELFGLRFVNRLYQNSIAFKDCICLDQAYRLVKSLLLDLSLVSENIDLVEVFIVDNMNSASDQILDIGQLRVSVNQNSATIQNLINTSESVILDHEPLLKIIAEWKMHLETHPLNDEIIDSLNS